MENESFNRRPMREGNYTKPEVCKILGFNEKEFDTFLKDSVGIDQAKEIYTFTELMLIKKVKNFESIIDALLLDPPVSESE